MERHLGGVSLFTIGCAAEILQVLRGTDGFIQCLTKGAPHLPAQCSACHGSVMALLVFFRTSAWKSLPLNLHLLQCSMNRTVSIALRRPPAF